MICIEEIVVVNFVGTELVRLHICLVLLGVALVDIFADELAEDEDEGLDIGKNLVFFIFLQLLQHIFLGYGVSSQKVSYGAQQNGVGQLDIDSYVLLQQIHYKLPQIPLLEVDLNLINHRFALTPIFGPPLVNFEFGVSFLRLRGVLVTSLNEIGDVLKEEYLLLGCEGSRVAGIHVDDSPDEFVLILTLVVGIHLFEVLVPEVLLNRD